MTNKKTAVPFVIIFTIVFFGFLGLLASIKLYASIPHFKDAEGNELPYRALDSLIHYNEIQVGEDCRDTVKKYFPTTGLVECRRDSGKAFYNLDSTVTEIYRNGEWQQIKVKIGVQKHYQPYDKD